jgi:hypothetical protein
MVRVDQSVICHPLACFVPFLLFRQEGDLKTNSRENADVQESCRTSQESFRAFCQRLLVTTRKRQNTARPEITRGLRITMRLGMLTSFTPESKLKRRGKAYAKVYAKK